VEKVKGVFWNPTNVAIERSSGLYFFSVRGRRGKGSANRLGSQRDKEYLMEKGGQTICWKNERLKAKKVPCGEGKGLDR